MKFYQPIRYYPFNIAVSPYYYINKEYGKYRIIMRNARET